MNIGGRNSSTEPHGGRTTLDDIFRLAAARHPHTLGLCDPPNRISFTDGEPRRLTWAQADAAVTRLAHRLRVMGLPADSVIAFQLPNIVESVIALLAILRAGMIAAPMPLLWRRADCVAALSRAGAKALITRSHAGDTRHGELAMQVASELFPIRHVCGFGETLPEGVTPLDEIFATAAHEPDVLGNGGDLAADQVAVVTFEVTPEGHVPVARSHVELLAAALPGLLEGGVAPDCTIVSALPASSFAGISLTVGPWLLAGGTLALHHAFDPAAFSAQLEVLRCNHVILPGPLASQIADAGLLSTEDELKSVLAVWRTPERLASAGPWMDADIGITDVSVFGELALVAARRAGSEPRSLRPGPQTAPYGTAGAVAVADFTRTPQGTLGIRGPMVPRHAFPPGRPNAWSDALKPDEAGFIDSGFTCRIDNRTGALIVTGPPTGLVTVGGYRFSMRELQDQTARIDAQASLAAFPDAFAGQRLAGRAADRAGMRRALAEAGLNPLVAHAFRDRGEARRA